MINSGLTRIARVLGNGTHPGRLIYTSCAVQGCTGSVESSNTRCQILPITHCLLKVENDPPQTAKLKKLNISANLQTPTFLMLNPLAPSIHTPGLPTSGITIGHIKDHNIKAILDPTVSADLIGDRLPDGLANIIGDNPETFNQPEYKARHIQKIRRWHMNRHQLKRLKKRMKMVYRKRRFEKGKQKRARLNVVINAIKEDAHQFDALAFVKQRLERAKRGGFVQDIWKSENEQPGVPWRKYGVFPPRKTIRTYETQVKPPPLLTKKILKFRMKMSKYR